MQDILYVGPVKASFNIPKGWQPTRTSGLDGSQLSTPFTWQLPWKHI